MVQLQAVVQGFSCDLYLQANMAAPATRYYEHQGFVQTATNMPSQLPETLSNWWKQGKKEEEAKSPFVYFVTDEENINDARRRKVDPEAPEVRAEFMHLLKLEGLMKLMGSSLDVAEVSLVQHCLPPNCRGNTPFLKTPFSDTATCFNSSTKDLPLLDHQWLKFNKQEIMLYKS